MDSKICNIKDLKYDTEKGNWEIRNQQEVVGSQFWVQIQLSICLEILLQKIQRIKQTWYSQVIIQM